MTLAAIPSPSTGVWHLGPIPLRAYALCIVLGIIAACVVTEVRMRRRGAPEYAILDIAVWAVPFGIVGARIYHVITSPDDYFGAGGHPLNAFKIWEGGLGIWGAVAGGAVGAWIAARKLGIPLTFVADALAPGLPLAQAIGRWGNWFNNELYGGLTTLPWGLKVHQMDGGSAALDSAGQPVELDGLYHPTFLYESLWDLGVALLVWLADRRYRFGRGRAFALYVMAYTVGRFWIEAMRSDPAHEFLGMRVNNWVSILVFLGALAYFLRVRGPQERLRVDADGTVHVVTPGSVDATAGDSGPGDRRPSDGPSGDGPAADDPSGDGPSGDGVTGQAVASDGATPDHADGDDAAGPVDAEHRSGGETARTATKQ